MKFYKKMYNVVISNIGIIVNYLFNIHQQKFDNDIEMNTLFTKVQSEIKLFWFIFFVGENNMISI